MILERLIQHVHPGKWDELEKLDAKWTVIESRLGYPPKRRYRTYFGENGTDTLVIEREWESLAALEATQTKAFADPEIHQLYAQGAGIIDSNRQEIYVAL